MGLRERLADRVFGSLIAQRVKAAVNAYHFKDEQWYRPLNEAGPNDLRWEDRKAQIDEALEAWRSNPLGSRIVSLVTDYVVGSGITMKSEVAWVQKFIDDLWHHSKNELELRIYRWCDELTRSGELFIVMHTNPADGMTYFREIPASRIDEIRADSEDLERELAYHEMTDDAEGRWWRADGITDGTDSTDSTDGMGPVVVHYAINRAVGCTRGQGDLGVILPWLAHYKRWLEDRVRINRYKSAFVWQVTLQGANRAQIEAKRAAYAVPPSPGSILITDENEVWSAVAPKLEAWDAESDGKAIRLMLATGAGLPLHFLSEGEAATKATATEMGDPTFRHFEHRQRWFRAMLVDLMERAVRRAKTVSGRGLGWKDLKMSSVVQDLTKEDNAKLADAASKIVQTLKTMRELGWVNDKTAMEMAYRFAGESVNVDELMEAIGTTPDGSGSVGEVGDGAAEVAAPGRGPGR